MQWKPCPAYDPRRTSVLLVDPFNDFLSEDGKIWPRHATAFAGHEGGAGGRARGLLRVNNTEYPLRVCVLVPSTA
ncbi:hypothetical protein [Streptomyces sp. NBC_01483]|uniref:hypothetical protein n=1 Tax=Streptomyces sp. NBC_01483 TaxID=2903883 RepID=UPI002E33E130|nr:hypothetical protein [Streptomyces sp. NBC_01483]